MASMWIVLTTPEVNHLFISLLAILMFFSANCLPIVFVGDSIRMFASQSHCPGSVSVYPPAGLLASDVQSPLIFWVLLPVPPGDPPHFHPPLCPSLRCQPV